MSDKEIFDFSSMAEGYTGGMEYADLDLGSIDVIKIMKKKYEEEYRKMGCFNIMITGKTGVGKSTLVNAVFGQKVAETGIGRPVTQEIQVCAAPGVPLRIYDTVGIEINNVDKIKKDTIELVQKNKGNMNDMIHCIWYCVSGVGDRFETEEENFIRSLATECGIPVIVVITKSYGKNSVKLKEHIDSIEDLHIKRSFRVLADDFELDEEYTKKAFGCDKLVEYTSQIIPEEVKNAFVAVQKANLALKKKRAEGIIAATVTIAFGTGFTPLPVADSLILVPTQIGMLASISLVYGIELKKSTLKLLCSTLGGTATTTIVGKTIVSNLFKLIPGVGTVVGGFISGSTASALTWALGRVYIRLMESIIRGEIDEKTIESEEYCKQFMDEIRENMNKKEEAESDSDAENESSVF